MMSHIRTSTWLVKRASSFDHTKVPVFTVPRLQNAMYISPDKMEELHNDESLKPYIPRTLSAKKYPHGVILQDPEIFKRNSKTVTAHELGHAQIDTEGGLSGFNQRWLRPAGGILAALSPMVGYITGRASENMLLGGGVGLGAAALGMTPTLISEYQAHNRGRQYHKRYNEPTESKAIGTYWGAAALASLLAGGMGALGGFTGSRLHSGEHLSYPPTTP